MTDAGVRKRPHQSGDEAGPVFDVLVTKLRIPPTRPGSVRRALLVDRLERDVSHPIVSVVTGRSQAIARARELGLLEG